MKKWWWIVRAWFYLTRYFGASKYWYGLAEDLHENYAETMSPKEAVDEDITYWY